MLLYTALDRQKQPGKSLFAECPPPVTITSNDSPYKAGDVLTCAADGVSLTYEWSGTNGGVSFNATSSTVTLEEGEFCLICTATDNSDTNCSACAFLCGSAEGKYRKPNSHLVTKFASRFLFSL